MRRPRTKLQVSTFPFLAVLLCVMGALLFLLFLMDRRAKIAAQHTASAALAERQKRTQEEEDARQAEWQKAKDALHQTLLDQQNDLLAQSRGLQQNVADAGQKLAVVQTQHLDLNAKIEKEATQVAQLQAQIAGQRTGLTDADRKEGKSRAELIEAAKELADLERAFKQLRALKDREKQIYSVVPYRGKQGEKRAPIYVECGRDGVLFHPEKKRLDGRDFTADALRAEVERRAGPLLIEKSTKEKGRVLAEERKGPYVLFLVRPEGIGHYYKAQSALKGYQLDFGYELVDEDWVLDFQGEATAPPPPALAKTTEPRKPGVAMVSPGSGVETPAPNNPLLGAPAIVPPLPGLGKGPAALPGGIGKNTFGGGPAIAPPLPAIGKGPAASPGGPAIAPPRIAGFVPIKQSGGPVPIATSGSAGSPTTAKSGAEPHSGGPPENPLVAKSDATRKPDAAGETPMNGQADAEHPRRPTGAAGNSGDDALRGPAPLPFPSPDANKKPPAAPAISRILGNKDFVITIDCYADHVTVFPSGLQYRWNNANAKANDDALVQTVTNLIARRQASVRPGEPPYRPLIRFQVSADGLRSYHRVFPLLEHLRVPMTRENVED